MRTRPGKRTLAIALLVTAIGLTAASGAPSVASAYPLVSAAGDISCDPRSRYFNGGAGIGGYCRQRDTSNLLRGSDAVLTMGDNQYEHGTLSNFRRSYDRSWGRFKTKTYPAIGNHEYAAGLECGPVSCSPRPDPSGYFDYFGRRADPLGNGGYYSFDIGDWHLIALNSMCWAVGGCHAGSRQERWLRRDLAANRGKKCVLAYWHHPRFSSGQGPNSEHYIPWWRDLHDARADVILVGHDHVYERFGRQTAHGRAANSGPMQFLVGTGGKNIGDFTSVERNSRKRLREHGVLGLRLFPDRFAWRFARAGDNRTLDSGSSNCR